jgi:hypothetical protein
VGSASLRGRRNETTLQIWWCNFHGRGPITQWQVAALLRPFEVCPQIHHPTKRANKTARGYLKSQFVERFARFPRPNTYTRTLPKVGSVRVYESEGRIERKLRV